MIYVTCCLALLAHQILAVDIYGTPNDLPEITSKKMPLTIGGSFPLENDQIEVILAEFGSGQAQQIMETSQGLSTDAHYLVINSNGSILTADKTSWSIAYFSLPIELIPSPVLPPYIHSAPTSLLRRLFVSKL